MGKGGGGGRKWGGKGMCGGSDLWGNERENLSGRDAFVWMGGSGFVKKK